MVEEGHSMAAAVTLGKRTTLLCYGFGSLLLLTSMLGGFVLGDEMAALRAGDRAELWKQIAAGDEAAAVQAQEAFLISRDRLVKQKGLSDTARRVRLAALDESMDIFVAMMGRLATIKGSDPGLEGAEAKTLLKCAAAIVERLEVQQSGSTTRDLLEIAVKGASVPGLILLWAGLARSFPIAGFIFKPFRALAGFRAT
jgi:hypothetical protein